MLTEPKRETLSGRMPISFLPTPYRVRVNESRFFAPTALDCLRLPALLGETIEVESICPSNGTVIQLTITGQGVTILDPPGCVMSVAAPGMAPANAAGNLDDPHSLTRQLAHFFSSPEAAALWLVAYPDVAILDIERAWQLVNDVTLDRDRAGLVAAGNFIE